MNNDAIAALRELQIAFHDRAQPFIEVLVAVESLSFPAPFYLLADGSIETLPKEYGPEMAETRKWILHRLDALRQEFEEGAGAIRKEFTDEMA